MTPPLSENTASPSPASLLIEEALAKEAKNDFIRWLEDHEGYVDGMAVEDWDVPLYQFILAALRKSKAAGQEEKEREQTLGESGCQDCSRPYGRENGFPDLIIPFWAWKKISPSGDDAGLLCPSCICKRLHVAGIRCEGAFMSGPIISVSQVAMSNLRRVENIELAIEGRDNRWSGVREIMPNDQAISESPETPSSPTSPAVQEEPHQPWCKMIPCNCRTPAPASPPPSEEPKILE